MPKHLDSCNGAPCEWCHECVSGTCVALSWIRCRPLCPPPPAAPQGSQYVAVTNKNGCPFFALKLL